MSVSSEKSFDPDFRGYLPHPSRLRAIAKAANIYPFLAAGAAYALEILVVNHK
jgi:hypothetical protein